MNVFPPRNLPARSDAWGRAIEGDVKSEERDLLQLSQEVNNWNRYTGGQLSVMSRSIQEVIDRSTESRALSTLSVSGSAVAEPFPRTNTAVTFTAVPKTRNALVTLSGTVSTNNTSVFVRLYAYLLFRGQIIASGWVQPAIPSSTPLEWRNNSPLFLHAPIQTVDGVAPEITIRLVRAADSFSPGTSTLSLNDPILTLTRSGVSNG